MHGNACMHLNHKYVCVIALYACMLACICMDKHASVHKDGYTCICTHAGIRIDMPEYVLISMHMLRYVCIRMHMHCVCMHDVHVPSADGPSLGDHTMGRGGSRGTWDLGHRCMHIYSYTHISSYGQLSNWGQRPDANKSSRTRRPLLDCRLLEHW